MLSIGCILSECPCHHQRELFSPECAVVDFMHDAVALGRSIRVLNVVDAYTRESLAMEVDTSFAGLRVTRVFD